MKNPKIDLIFLGTGAGIQTKKRLESGILLKNGGCLNILFDPGSAIVERLLKSDITPCDIDYIFITHLHPDHTQGLSSILFGAKYQFALRKKDLTIIGPVGFKNFYSKLLGTYGHTITPELYKIKIIEVKNKSLLLDKFKVTSLKTLHTPESVGYRLQFDKKSITYSGDTDYCENLIKLSKKSNITILECSFPDDIKIKNHLTPKLAGIVARKSNSKTLILTHFFPICEKYDIIAQCRKEFKGRIIRAYDFLKVRI